MRNLRRFAARASILFILFLPMGCAVEEPYPPWSATKPYSLSPEDVAKLLVAGVSEDAICAAIRMDGISARATPAEIRALRLLGASDRLLAMVLSAGLIHHVPTPTIEGPRLHWPQVPPLPGFWPVDVWLWLDRTLKAFPSPAPPIEAEP